MTDPIEYHVRPVHPGGHRFEVTCTVPDPDPEGQRLVMAGWIPGSYVIRDFARHVICLEASSDGEAVAVEKIDKATWRCAPCRHALRVTYEVYAFDLSVRGAYLDNARGYFNGPCLFLAVAGREASPCTVLLERPAGEAFAHWRVATSMRRAGAPAHGFGTYAADDYDELIDHPVEMGEFALGRFEVQGIPHEVAVCGRHGADMERLCRDLEQICTHHLSLFGDPTPIDRYLFLVMAVGDAYGGLEHRWSSSNIIGRDHLPRVGREEITKPYRRLLGVLSHEYFHLWNVKRIKPAVFTPFDLSREVHTRMLWVFEGITSYYDDLALARSGVIAPESYLELLGETITGVSQTPGRFKQSIAESSFDAWIKLYKRDENSVNAIISYYTKGSLAALALDLTIRRETAGDKSLDDVMRAMWLRFGEEGVPESGFERLAAEVTGLDLTDFFDRAVRGTEDLPLGDLLADVGVSFELLAMTTELAAQRSLQRDTYLPALGVKLAPEGGAVRLTQVLDGSVAQQAGLSAGDELVAVNGIKVTASDLPRLSADHGAGDRLELHVFRRDELMRFALDLREPPADTCRLTFIEKPDARTLQNRRSWLGIRAGS